jgi:hypothetical protein
MFHAQKKRESIKRKFSIFYSNSIKSNQQYTEAEPRKTKFYSKTKTTNFFSIKIQFNLLNNQTNFFNFQSKQYTTKKNSKKSPTLFRMESKNNRSLRSEFKVDSREFRTDSPAQFENNYRSLPSELERQARTDERKKQLTRNDHSFEPDLAQNRPDLLERAQQDVYQQIQHRRNNAPRLSPLTLANSNPDDLNNSVPSNGLRTPNKTPKTPTTPRAPVENKKETPLLTKIIRENNRSLNYTADVSMLDDSPLGTPKTPRPLPEMGQQGRPESMLNKFRQPAAHGSENHENERPEERSYLHDDDLSFNSQLHTPATQRLNPEMYRAPEKPVRNFGFNETQPRSLNQVQYDEIYDDSIYEYYMNTAATANYEQQRAQSIDTMNVLYAKMKKVVVDNTNAELSRRSRHYNDNLLAELPRRLSSKIRENLKALLRDHPDYRFIVHVYATHRQDDVKLGLQCFCDATEDLYFTYVFSDDEVYCLATAFAIKY